MDGRALRHGRLGLAAVAAIAALVALPATAYAHSATRLVAVKTMTVDNSTLGLNPWPTTTLDARLQKRITRTHYHALTGTVKLYQWDDYDEVYYYTGISRRGSSVSLPLPGRGKYKLYYAKTSKTLASSAYATVYEDIGLTLDVPEITLSAVESSSTQSWVTITYAVNWNPEAWSGRVVVATESYFEDPLDDLYEGVWIYYENEALAPGSVEFNYKVANADALGVLASDGNAYVLDYYDPYIKPAEQMSSEWTVPTPL
jgi:hypothetical protein